MEKTSKRRELTQRENEDAARLRNAWEAYKARNEGTQEWLGRETGIGSQGVIGQYLRGVIPLNLNALLNFCRVLDVPPETISPTLAALMPPKDMAIGTPIIPIENGDEMPEGYVSVQRYKLKIAGGEGHIQWEIDEEDQPHAYSLSYLRSKGIQPKNAKRVKVIGDSMESTLYDGESALIDCGDTAIRDGKVYALR